jgi:hypothetical protein
MQLTDKLHLTNEDNMALMLDILITTLIWLLLYQIINVYL